MLQAVTRVKLEQASKVATDGSTKGHAEASSLSTCFRTAGASVAGCGKDDIELQPYFESGFPHGHDQ